MTGKVIETRGYHSLIRTYEYGDINCILQGKLRQENITSTNPVAVGDNVEIVYDEKTKTGSVINVMERKNYVVRRSAKLSKSIHIIAANVDSSYLIVNVSKPVTLLSFIDRFLVSNEAYRVPTTIIINKTDILNKKEKEDALILENIYQKAGYEVLFTSAKTNEGIDILRNRLKGQTSLFSGNSGVGKSALLNALQPNFNLKEGNLSDFYQMGKHTTTFSKMLFLDKDTAMIDTPGLKAFGLVAVEKDELAMYFPEFKSRLQDCKFYNCTHLHEPHCAVIAALENGEISLERYNNYVKIYESYDEY
ncbi:MAG: ribosome small subunit-dependent GTPase A [Bacteroidales bacterium]|jgi:ribosome biogenesis GTPase|nr:ribosome small subunit-dependent GTPase A [Bacteroidales bacterium]